MLEQPCQERLTSAITKRLRRDPGGDMNDRAGHCAGPLYQRFDERVAAFQCNQCSGVKCEASQSGSDIAITLSAQA
jgi:hypothetical protein